MIKEISGFYCYPVSADHNAAAADPGKQRQTLAVTVSENVTEDNNRGRDSKGLLPVGLDCHGKLFKNPLLCHGNIVTAGIFDHIHHLISLADDLVRALGVFRIGSQTHAAADLKVQ